jgi:hypothetical protein
MKKYLFLALVAALPLSAQVQIGKGVQVGGAGGSGASFPSSGLPCIPYASSTTASTCLTSAELAASDAVVKTPAGAQTISQGTNGLTITNSSTGNYPLTIINNAALSGTNGLPGLFLQAPNISTGLTSYGIGFGTQQTDGNYGGCAFVNTGSNASTNFMWCGIRNIASPAGGMSISNIGNVGIGYMIGTAAPTGSRLTVNGNVAATSFNSVALTTGGSTSLFLNQLGTYTSPAGGGGSPSGSNFSIQYNNGGSFGGASFTGIAYNNGTSSAPSAIPSQSADSFLAAPCGSSGVPAFRGICLTDLPNSSVQHLAGMSMYLDFLPQHISSGTVQDQSGNSNNATFGATPPTSTSIGITNTVSSSVNLPAAVNSSRTFEMGINIGPYSIPASFSTYFGASTNSGPLFFEGGSIGNPTFNALPALSMFLLPSDTTSTNTAAYLSTGNHDIIITCGTGSGDLDHYYFDGVEVSNYLTQTFGGCGTLSAGNYVIGNNPIIASAGFVGTMYEFITRSAELNSTQVLQEHQAIQADIFLRGVGNYGLPWNASGPYQVSQGDSLTSCQGASSPATCWINELTLSSSIPTLQVIGLGNPGKSAAAIAYSSTSVGLTYCASNNGPNIATLFNGTNDFLYFPSATGVSVGATNMNEVQILSQGGCRVFVGTPISRGNGFGAPANAQTWDFNLQALAKQIRLQSKASGATGIMDFATIPGIGCTYCSGSPITNIAITSNVLTVAANNAWSAGQTVTYSGLTTNTFLNTTTCVVSATALSTTSYQCPYTHANVTSVADTGYATSNLYQTDTTHLTDAGYALLAAGASNSINYAFGSTRANPSLISATPYSILASDGYIESSIAGNATWTLPSCIGQSGAIYTINNSTGFSITLKNLDSSQPINGTDYSSSGLVIPVNFSLWDVPNAGGNAGCHWSSAASSTGGGSGTVTSVTSATADATVATTTTTPVITIVSAPKLTTARAINGVNFDGTAAITVAAAAGTLTGATLASGVTASSLTSFGAAIALGTPASGNASNLTALNATQLTSGTIPTAATAALTGDITKSAGSNATIVVALNGTSLSGLATGLLKNTTATGVPSIAVSGTDYVVPSGSITGNAATATNILTCADTSASGTAQSCTTSPSFTPVANSCLVYTTTTANTGAALTLNVNALGAKSVAKWLGSTTLVAGDVPANRPVVTCYDGTNWELSTIGNAPSGVTSVTGTANQINSSGGATPTLTLSSTIALPGTLTSATAGAASTPAVTLSGAPFTGGSGTTTFPQFYMNSGGTAPTALNTAGTIFGINAPSGFTGNHLDFHINGAASIFSVGATGAIIARSISANGGVGQISATGLVQGTTLGTVTNCSSSASPAVCASAPSGSAVVAAAATTVVVNTTAVTANSQIQLTVDSSLGTKLSVTCNTTPSLLSVSARTAATSFTVTSSAPITNPLCFSYTIVN